MNLFFILLFLALVAAGYYVYQRLLKIEREIRAEQHTSTAAEGVPASEPEPAASAPEPVPQAVVSGETPGVKEQILLAVQGAPGLAQTELYAKFPDEDRRDLQKLLRELDHSGQLRREKKGSSYRLHPL